MSRHLSLACRRGGLATLAATTLFLAGSVRESTAQTASIGQVPKYQVGRPFLVIIDAPNAMPFNGKFPPGTKAKRATFSPFSDAPENDTRFRVLATKRMGKGPNKGKKLAVVLVADPVAPPLPVMAMFGANSYIEDSGEITVNVDTDDDDTTDFDSDPVPIEPMPDPCPPGAPGPRVAPAPAPPQVPAP